MISMLYTGPGALTGAGVSCAAASAPAMSALAARPSLRCNGAMRATMRGILMEPGRFAEAPQQIRGKLETGVLGGKLSRHAQLQWSLEAVLACARLGHAHHRGPVDPSALPEQHPTPLPAPGEPAHPHGPSR